MATPEGRVKDKFKRWMKKTFPTSWVFMPVQMGYGEHGVPDFLCCVPLTIRPEHVGKTIGTFVGVEAKAQKGKLSGHQQTQIDRIQAASGLAFVIKGVSDEFTKPLNKLKHMVLGDA